ncbi:MAG: PilZ domain-containing protein [Deltaproteobacteria bacterium]|jgi:hypothetical protein|nr:PilZ domain-containing protein [Deltaproteobacteria bacterium]MBW2572081.1 PilZ domain-containing protein [Deltaproteobacteria bacterium]MBW2671249.1 PilZ domain-containing protein [Deltaproteobacteria bacterium]NOQ19434.1 hypothetical protein [Desulfobacterales bacterium]
MKERRQFKRFTATLPTRVEAVMSDETRVFDLETKDISAAGAFLLTKESAFFPDGTRFIIGLTVPENSLKELTDLKSFLECEGNMVRSNSEGMAIQFDRECYIMGLRGS